MFRARDFINVGAFLKVKSTLGAGNAHRPKKECFLSHGGLSKLWSLFGSPKLGPVLGPVL